MLDDVAPCSAKWQERNGALEEVSNILKGAGGHVQPNIGNLLSLLKVRPPVCDPNYALNRMRYSYQSALVLNLLCIPAGPPVRHQCKSCGTESNCCVRAGGGHGAGMG